MQIVRNIPTWIVCSIFITCFISPMQQAESESANRRFLVESGIIEMKKEVISPAIQNKTTETIYFKNWGNTVATYTTSTTPNPYVKGDQVEHKFALLENGSLTVVNLDEKTGHKLQLSKLDKLKNMNKAQQKKFAENLKTAFGTTSQVIGEEEVAGKRCEMTEAVTAMAGMKQTSRICMWKNIILKKVSQGMGPEIREEAVSVQTDVAIPTDKFRIPQGIKFKEINRGLGQLRIRPAQNLSTALRTVELP